MTRVMTIAISLMLSCSIPATASERIPSPMDRLAALTSSSPHNKNMTPRPAMIAGIDCPADGSSWGHNCNCNGVSVPGVPNECERKCAADTYRCNGDHSQCECD